jgi:DNA-binding CsgD family transcriptional regulator
MPNSDQQQEALSLRPLQGMPVRIGVGASAAACSASVELSDREIETLTWAARGKTSAEIALIVGLSKRTVDFHIDNARAKLGVATRIEAAVKAAAGRLIEV